MVVMYVIEYIKSHCLKFLCWSHWTQESLIAKKKKKTSTSEELENWILLYGYELFDAQGYQLKRPNEIKMTAIRQV